jgi:probable HAF family extracellular repeat protein
MRHIGFALFVLSCAACSSSPAEQARESLPLRNARTACFTPTELPAIEPGFGMAPNDVNDRGQVVGVTIGPLFVRHGFLWQDGVLTDFGVGSTAAAITERGEIVGSAVIDGHVRAVVWKDGTRIDLGTLPGEVESRALAINERGLIAGWSGTHSFLWDHGVMTDLGTFRDQPILAFGISAKGEVLGSWVDGVSSRALVWKDGAATDLGTLGGVRTDASAINKHGTVVGSSATENETSVAFVWDGGVMTNLGTLGGVMSVAEGINDRGTIIASAFEGEASDTTHAFALTKGASVALGTLGGAGSRALAINNRDQIVGSADTADGRVAAFLWGNGTMTELPSPEGASKVTALRISQRGHTIAGWRNDGLRRVVIWRPCLD